LLAVIWNYNYDARTYEYQMFHEIRTACVKVEFESHAHTSWRSLQFTFYFSKGKVVWQSYAAWVWICILHISTFETFDRFWRNVAATSWHSRRRWSRTSYFPAVVRKFRGQNGYVRATAAPPTAGPCDYALLT